MSVLSYTKTSVKELKSQNIEQFGITVWVKEEFRNHPTVSGNKWWKLTFNLKEATRQRYNTLLTFGGAWSNHVYAVAAATKELNLHSIGVIRGEEREPLTDTLQFAKACGMKLHFVSRELYRKKSEEEFLSGLREKFGSFYLLPEGGTNSLAVKGCAAFAESISHEAHFDYVCLPVGTGGTLAGLAEGLKAAQEVIGIPVLKGAYFLEEEIKKYTSKRNWQLIYDYHFGGYAKVPEALLKWMKHFEEEQGIPLDPVYTAKMMYGVMDLIQRGFFKRGSTVLIIHTGGLQGRLGFRL
jgi:1-aminocyclopropane-1-carboxylate deaminase